MSPPPLDYEYARKTFGQNTLLVAVFLNTLKKFRDPDAVNQKQNTTFSIIFVQCTVLIFTHFANRWCLEPDRVHRLMTRSTIEMLNHPKPLEHFTSRPQATFTSYRMFSFQLFRGVKNQIRSKFFVIVLPKITVTNTSHFRYFEPR